MKRLHVHISVTALDKAVDFYSALFAAEPTVRKDDYAKWMLDDPRVNFAISTRTQASGIEHLGIQVDDESELADVVRALDRANLRVAQLRLHAPTLDDVFLEKTGRSLEGAAEEQNEEAAS